MKDILTGIRNAYRSNATLSNAIHGMYFDTASEGVSMPYITYHLITNVPTWDFGVTTYERPLIQFSIYSDKVKSASEVLQIYSDLVLVYDNVTINTTNHTQVLLQRGSSMLRKLGGDEVWLYSVDYNTMFEEN